MASLEWSGLITSGAVGEAGGERWEFRRSGVWPFSQSSHQAVDSGGAQWAFKKNWKGEGVLQGAGGRHFKFGFAGMMQVDWAVRSADGALLMTLHPKILGSQAKGLAMMFGGLIGKVAYEAVAPKNACVVDEEKALETLPERNLLRLFGWYHALSFS